MRFIAMTAAAAALVGGGAVASAADLSFKDTPSYPAAAAPIWSGLYVGGHLGGIWQGDRSMSGSGEKCVEKKGGAKPLTATTLTGGHHADGPPDEPSRAPDQPGDAPDQPQGPGEGGNDQPVGGDGDAQVDCQTAETLKFDDGDDDVTVVGGLHVGYNWQREALVLGVEADLDFADGFDYLASLRARLGYSAGDFLIYATAGVAFAKFDDRPFQVVTDQQFYSFGGAGDAEVGFVAGGGVEYKLSSNWSLGVEGLYYMFDDTSSSLSITEACGADCSSTYNVSGDDDNDFWTVRARLTYHFGSDDADAPLK